MIFFFSTGIITFLARHYHGVVGESPRRCCGDVDGVVGGCGRRMQDLGRTARGTRRHYTAHNSSRNSFRYDRYYSSVVVSTYYYSLVVVCTPEVLDIRYWKYPEGGGIMESTYLCLLLWKSGFIPIFILLVILLLCEEYFCFHKIF